MTKPRDGGQDLVGRLRPHERGGVRIREIYVPANGLLQLARTAVDAPAYLLLRQRGEPSLDEVDPRRAGRGEMHVEARMPHQPPPNRGSLVGAVVVEDQVHIEFGGHRGVDRAEEVPKLAGAMPMVKLAQDPPAPRLERREQ